MARLPSEQRLVDVPEGDVQVTKKVLRVLSLLPATYLVVGVSVFVVSGVDIMAGSDGGFRWGFLVMLSIWGAAAFDRLREKK